MYVLRFALKNVISRKSSIVIVAFIAFSLSLLVVANAVFDGTDSGMERTFVKSFTGNVVIRPKASFPLSLFGDETPVTGSLSDIPHLVPYAAVSEYAASQNEVTAMTGQFTCMAALNVSKKGAETEVENAGDGEENEDYKYSSYMKLDATDVVSVFGVDAAGYTSMMDGIEILEGAPFSGDERGAMLNESMVKAIQNEGGDVHVGSKVQLIVPQGVSATIRAVPVTAIYRYPVTNPMIDRIVLVDAPTARSLVGAQDVSEQSIIAEDEKNLIGKASEGGESSLDDLFAEAQDIASEEVGADTIAEEFQKSNSGEGNLSEDEVASMAMPSRNDGGAAQSATKFPAQSATKFPAQSTVWSFILCKTQSRKDTEHLIARFNHHFSKMDWPVEAIRWRNAAGGTVNLVYYLRVISNIGILLILLVGFIVVNNTLTVSSLGRICETGTVRALGGTRLFVMLQFFCETLILTLSAGIIGAGLGSLLNALLNNAEVPLGNSYLMQLFGSDTLVTRLTPQNIRGEMIISLALAFVGTVLPARIALSTSPVAAMRGQS